MEKRTKIILIVLGVLLLVLLLWLLTRYFGSRQPQEESEGTTGNLYPLCYGSKTKKNCGVATIQSVCNDMIGANLAIDGVWGPKTEEAVLMLRNKKLVIERDGTTDESYPFEQYIILDENNRCRVEDVTALNGIIRTANYLNTI